MILVVVLVVLFVVVPIVLGAIMSFMVSGLMEHSFEGEPNIQLDVRPVLVNRWDVTISGVSEEHRLNRFTAVLMESGMVVDVMDPIGGSSGLLNFTDLDGMGTLTVGDHFRVTCDPGTPYRLSIVWRESGNVRGSIDWQV